MSSPFGAEKVIVSVEKVDEIVRVEKVVKFEKVTDSADTPTTPTKADPEPEWVEAVNKKTGQPYYINTATEERRSATPFTSAPSSPRTPSSFTDFFSKSSASPGPMERMLSKGLSTVQQELASPGPMERMLSSVQQELTTKPSPSTFEKVLREVLPKNDVVKVAVPRAAARLQAHARGARARRMVAAMPSKKRARELDAEGLELNRRGDIDGAIAFFRRACELDPEEPKYLLSLANLQGKSETAVGDEAAGGEEGEPSPRRVSVATKEMYEKLLDSPQTPEHMRAMAAHKLGAAKAADTAAERVARAHGEEEAREGAGELARRKSVERAAAEAVRCALEEEAAAAAAAARDAMAEESLKAAMAAAARRESAEADRLKEEARAAEEATEAAAAEARRSSEARVEMENQRAATEAEAPPAAAGSGAAAAADAAPAKAATAESTGDYAAAEKELKDAMSDALSDEDLADDEKTRAKVNALVKLGEMKWRYRVVEKGQSPRDEAIRVLETAQRYVDTHVRKAIGAIEEESETPEAESLEGTVERLKAAKWGAELSECCQGLALARLIFNGNNRDEDATITSMLEEALRMREALGAKLKIAETRNSLGALAQKQKDHARAEAEYTKSLETRQQLPGATEAETKDREQALAQSHVSLGNLFLEMEDYPRALDSLKRAKQCYVVGFGATDHPKVAWAVEAMAAVYKKQKAWRLADEAIDEAIAIRKALQDKSDGQQLFSQELDVAEASNTEIEAQRKSIQDTMKKSSVKGLFGGAGKGSSKNILLAAKAAKKEDVAAQAETEVVASEAENTAAVAAGVGSSAVTTAISAASLDSKLGAAAAEAEAEAEARAEAAREAAGMLAELKAADREEAATGAAEAAERREEGARHVAHERARRKSSERMRLAAREERDDEAAQLRREEERAAVARKASEARAAAEAARCVALDKVQSDVREAKEAEALHAAMAAAQRRSSKETERVTREEVAGDAAVTKAADAAAAKAYARSLSGDEEEIKPKVDAPAATLALPWYEQQQTRIAMAALAAAVLVVVAIAQEGVLPLM